MDFNDEMNNQNSSTTPNRSEEQNQFTYESKTYRYGSEKKSSGKGAIKSVVSVVAAGVVGSVLTLAVLPHTSYLNNINSSQSNPQPVSAVAPVSTSAKASTPSSSGSVADTVSKVSKAIVGIENYQQQSTNDPFGNSDDGFGSFGSFGSSDGSSDSSDNSQPADTGSGIIFKKDGNNAYIVTNNHVVEGGSKIEVSLYNGTKTSAKLVGTDALTDLAVLEIDAKNVTDIAQFGDSSTLRPGDPVYAIGNPLGLDLSRTVTSGIVSATNRTISEPTSAGNWDANVIQTDAAINPGNSGGALINSQGLVMGINSSKISETGVEGIGFAIPSDDAIPIINQLISNGKIERPYLGVGLVDLNQIPQMYWQNMPSSVTQGVMISNVASQSAAANSGLKTKDVIVSMNGTAIKNSTDLREFLYTKVKIGDTVDFGLYRNGKLMHVKVKLTAKTSS